MSIVEAMTIVGFYALATIILLATAYVSVLAGYAIWGHFSGFGVMNAIRPILDGCE